MENMKKIIIDTDIGDDIDDAYALVCAAKMDCFDILGVTTVYRNSLQRAGIAAALLRALAPRAGLTGIAWACGIGWCAMLCFEIPYYFHFWRKRREK